MCFFASGRIYVDGGGRGHVFRRDDNAEQCLRWWRARCVEWCFQTPEPDRWLDQKYLDEVPRRFQGVHVLHDPPVNMAIWNIDNSDISIREGIILADGSP
jgi:hypothetical protein